MDPRRSARQLRDTALLVALFVGGCVAATPAQMDAARNGRADARRDVERGRPRTAWIGLLHDLESPIDPATGFVQFSIGCCKSHERLAYRDAYEEEMAAARTDGRVTGARLLAKVTTRDAVAARFGDRTATGTYGPGEIVSPPPGVEVRVGQGAATSPGGRFRVEAAPASGVYGIALWSIDTRDGVREELRRLGADRVLAVFDDGGETLFIRDLAAGCYATFDLPTALPLQVFPVSSAR